MVTEFEMGRRARTDWANWTPFTPVEPWESGLGEIACVLSRRDTAPDSQRRPLLPRTSSAEGSEHGNPSPFVNAAIELGTGFKPFRSDGKARAVRGPIPAPTACGLALAQPASGTLVAALESRYHDNDLAGGVLINLWENYVSYASKAILLHDCTEFEQAPQPVGIMNMVTPSITGGRVSPRTSHSQRLASIAKLVLEEFTRHCPDREVLRGTKIMREHGKIIGWGRLLTCERTNWRSSNSIACALLRIRDVAQSAFGVEDQRRSTAP
ncbi:hypothetical protein CERSUDRAFT_73321 [Gelatoporia subvermispora B]|uniref:Uncharacterized protein n=1 Tax=Ceriporiopsis subvermispora (strain B) TaxID=914234 RepID=M2QZ57_CERS8|nr:hypothetical protein CERSUDRAFT_73321 [Gelatoporia subvermispora B]